MAVRAQASSGIGWKSADLSGSQPLTGGAAGAPPQRVPVTLSPVNTTNLVSPYGQLPFKSSLGR